MISAGDPIGAYAKAPQPEPAFKRVAGSLLTSNDPKLLGELLSRRRSDAPADPWIEYYQGRLLETSQDYAAATKSFLAAMNAATNRADKLTFRYAEVAASYRAGTGIESFRALGTKEAFTQLAGLYARDRNPDGLQQLLNEEANRTGRDALDVAYWNAKVASLRGDFSSAITTLFLALHDSAPPQRSHFRETDLLIRCLTRAGRFDEAMAQAAASSRTGRPSAWYVALIEASRGNVTRATAAMDEVLKEDEEDNPQAFYGDPDLSIALRAPAFAQWRKAHPAPLNSSGTTKPSSPRPAADSAP